MKLLKSLWLSLVLFAFIISVFTGCGVDKSIVSVTPPDGFSEAETSTKEQVSYYNQNGSSVLVSMKNYEDANLDEGIQQCISELRMGVPDVRQLGDPFDLLVTERRAKGVDLAWDVNSDNGVVVVKFRQVLVINKREGLTLFQYSAREEHFDEDLSYFEDFLDSAVFG